MRKVYREIGIGVAVFGVVAVIGSTPLRLQAGQDSVPAGSSESAGHKAVLAKYCVTCHNARLRTANLDLGSMNLDQLAAHPDVWEKVVLKLRSGAMPPAGRPRPDHATYDALAGWLETGLDRAAAANPNPGRRVVHRLNRVEYTNAIRDLLALEIDGRSLLPTDESGYGFDNIADVLALSPGLLERYMLAAQKISRLAIGDPTITPTAETHTLSLALVQEERMNEDLPFGSRGGTVIRQNFPLDGEYRVRIRLRRSFNAGVIRGLAQREEIDVRLDGERVKLFAVGGECVDSDEPRCAQRPSGNAVTSEYYTTADDPLEVRFSAKAGLRAIGVTFLRQAAAPEGAAARPPATLAYSTDDYDGQMDIYSVQIEGPLAVAGQGDTPSRRRIFACRPASAQEEEPCARKILTTLARRAYRRPVADRDLQHLLALYKVGRSDGSFESGIQLALEGLLVSPNFLVRIERDPANAVPGKPHRLTDLEIASRLSFFLWSSIPDDELLDIATRGQLKSPQVLEQQVRRMLRDPRSTSLISNFAGQWLYLRNMRVVTPDPRMFPEFDENLREAFQRETELFLESQLREDRSVLDMLTANYTYLNERLAKFYGIPGVYGSQFRRVQLSDDRRDGLLGHGSVLTVTSYPTRTSPVVRGKWLLENLFGAPPPPPPPDVVTDLGEETKPGLAAKSVRERLQNHRKNPVCSSCHSRMDPLGFALENFNGIGKWRTLDGHTPIDATGVLPDSSRFDGPVEFRKTLMTHRNEFISTLTEKLLTYSLGRGTEAYDLPAVRKIMKEAAASDNRWSAIVLGIVKSMPFQMRTAQEQASAANAVAQAKRN
jgi:hypothetical protein